MRVLTEFRQHVAVDHIRRNLRDQPAFVGRLVGCEPCDIALVAINPVSWIVGKNISGIVVIGGQSHIVHTPALLKRTEHGVIPFVQKVSPENENRRIHSNSPPIAERAKPKSGGSQINI